MPVNLTLMFDSIVCGVEVVGAFLLAMVTLYIIVRVTTLAYFKSKQEHDNPNSKGQ